MQTLRLIHLSDIHFKLERSGGVFDLDTVLRNEIGRDIGAYLSGPASAILVTGDIAFAGRKAEYVDAHGWLSELCEVTQCEPSNVYTVPGNHDIDRDQVDTSDAIRGMHRDLRASHGPGIDQKLSELLADSVNGPGLLAPMGAYNEFAVRYGCDISPTRCFWEDDLELNDGSVLRLHGLTSALVSDRLDNDGNAKLVLGRHQARIIREDGVEHMTLCHHPYGWLLDGDAIEDALRHARVRLFGHKHRFRPTRVDDSVVLAAGATHPDRLEENWEPRYNIIELLVNKAESGQRLLDIKIHARVWDDKYQSFKPDVNPDGKPTIDYEFPLSPWEPTKQITQIASSLQASPSQADTKEVNALQTVKKPERVLLYRYVSLPYQRQVKIALDLSLISEEERFSDEAELWRAVFFRARDSGRLNALWEAVEADIGDSQYKDFLNPFSLRRH